MLGPTETQQKGKEADSPRRQQRRCSPHSYTRATIAVGRIRRCFVRGDGRAIKRQARRRCVCWLGSVVAELLWAIGLTCDMDWSKTNWRPTTRAISMSAVPQAMLTCSTCNGFPVNKVNMKISPAVFLIISWLSDWISARASAVSYFAEESKLARVLALKTATMRGKYCYNKGHDLH